MSSETLKCCCRFHVVYHSESNASETVRELFEAVVWVKSLSRKGREESLRWELSSFFEGEERCFALSDIGFSQMAVEEIAGIYFEELEEFLPSVGAELLRLNLSINPARVVSLSSASAEYSAEKSAEKFTEKEQAYRRKGPLIPKFPDLHWEIHDELQREALPVVEKNLKTKIIVSVLILLFCSVFLSLWMKYTGIHPMGSDIYGHLFKGDLLYQRWKEGEFYPLYTELWYNGMQPFRYWAPLSYILLAGAEFLTGGDVLNAYFVLSGILCFAGGLGFILFGIDRKKPGFGFFLGMLWFFLPDNLRIFFSEGNLPRMVIGAILPYLCFSVWKAVKDRERKLLFPIAVLTAAVVLCHAMIAAMTGITVFLFLAVYAVISKRYRESVETICSMLCGIAVTGFWLIPALRGGIVGMNADATAEVMESLSVEASKSLNPFLRLAGDHGTFYFGLSLFLIAILGLLFAGKEAAPGFVTLLLVLLGSTPVFIPLLRLLPLSQLFWMQRFLPIASVFFLISLMEWKSLRKGAAIFFCIILTLDTLPSLWYLRFPKAEEKEMLSGINSSYLLEEGKEITNQRIAILDISLFGSFPSYQLCKTEPPVLYTFGWAWQGAPTASNIVRLNTAFQKGHYGYAFDRCVELGNDTVLVKRSLLPEKAEASLLNAAEKSGFALMQENENALLFHRDTPKRFGVLSSYPGLAIGNSACETAILFPALKEGESANLNGYTYDELSQYQLLYLSGFTYDSKEKAENLLRKLSQNGVRIVIDMQNLPSDPFTNQRELLGVTAHPVSFSESYPELSYQGVSLNPEPFYEGEEEWNTVFLSGLEQVTGECDYLGETLPFAGTGTESNIVFVGLNPLYHTLLTQDDKLLPMAEELMGLSASDLPQRELCEMTVLTKHDGMVISSARDNLNTTIAYQDIFTSSAEIRSENNLLIVPKGKTVLKFHYPESRAGLLITFLGFAGIFFFLVSGRKRPLGRIDR